MLIPQVMFEAINAPLAAEEVTRLKEASGSKVVK
jgi:hypothetical protein